VDAGAIHAVVVAYLNLLLGSSAEADDYWETEFFASVLRSFFARCLGDAPMDAALRLDEQCVRGHMAIVREWKTAILNSLKASVGMPNL
jgi:hypothetical protein